MPPLRERRTYIPLLIKAFLGQWNGRYQEEKQISEEAMQYLLEYPWAGNIRELWNSVTSMSPFEPDRAGASAGSSAPALQAGAEHTRGSPGPSR